MSSTAAEPPAQRLRSTMTVQRTGASQYAEWRCGRRRWLSLVADLCVGLHHHIMGSKKTRWRLILTLTAAWQLVVYALSAGGVFVTIYELLGIPWNTTGIPNVIGTTAGLAVLESPLTMVVGYILWRERRREHETTTAQP